jgi:predicted GH43/DUF377 family glycosyl hydrolase
VPILSPREEYERIGDTPNIIFSSGALVENGESLILYYGAADSCICMGTSSIENIKKHCLSKRKEY